jgi:uncharacterized protein YciW
MSDDVAQAEAERLDAWDDWLDHVERCRGDCFTAGIDCAEAQLLRAHLRMAITRHVAAVVAAAKSGGDPEHISRPDDCRPGVAPRHLRLV